MFDEPTRAGDRRRTCAASATRSRAAARASTSRSARCRRCCATSSRSRATWPRPSTHLSALLRRARPRRAHRRARRPRRRPSCSATWTSRSPRSTRSPARSSRTRSARARRRSTRRSARSRASARSCATASASSRSCSPGAQALHERGARPRGRVRGRHAARCKRVAGAQPRASPRCSSRCRRSPTTRWRRSASRTSPRPSQMLNPTLAVPRAGPGAVQLRRRCGSATSSCLLSEGDVHGTWQRFIIIATPQGPNNEGGSVVGARQRRHADARQLPALQPAIRTPRRRASPRRARPATSRSSPGASVIGNVPGNLHVDDGEDALMAAHRPPPPPRGRSPLSVGLIVLADRRRRGLPRLHEGHPVHPRVPRQRGLRVGELDPDQLARADRRRQRRQGQVGRAQGGHQPRRRDDGDRRRGAADPRGRDAPRSARASSWRATSSST